MSRFDEFVDEFVFMARNAADVASKKTGEVVETSKIRYQMKQVEWEIEKAYAKLGAIVYEAKKSADNFDEVIGLAVSEIDDLKARYEDLGEKMRNYKNMVKCPGCGKENDLNGAFCSRCGTPLATDAPQEENTEE
jgi:rRNA maturation endonuclease Nob1